MQREQKQSTRHRHTTFRVKVEHEAYNIHSDQKQSKRHTIFREKTEHDCTRHSIFRKTEYTSRRFGLWETRDREDRGGRGHTTAPGGGAGG